MKTIRLALITLALTLASAGSAYAHDSFSFGINIGGPGYYAPPPVRYYPAPPAVYYAPPPVYYANPYPRSNFRYYEDGPRHNHHYDGWGRRDWR